MTEGRSGGAEFNFHLGMVSFQEFVRILGMVIAPGMVTIIAILGIVALLGFVNTLRNSDHPWYSYHPRDVDCLKNSDHPSFGPHLSVDDHPRVGDCSKIILVTMAVLEKMNILRF